MMDIEKEIKELKHRVADLESRNMPSGPFNPTFNYGNKQCPKCGITLSGVMAYSCPNANCPTGLGSPMCIGSGNF